MMAFIPGYFTPCRDIHTPLFIFRFRWGWFLISFFFLQVRLIAPSLLFFFTLLFCSPSSLSFHASIFRSFPPFLFLSFFIVCVSAFGFSSCGLVLTACPLWIPLYVVSFNPDVGPHLAGSEPAYAPAYHVCCFFVGRQAIDCYSMNSIIFLFLRGLILCIYFILFPSVLFSFLLFFFFLLVFDFFLSFLFECSRCDIC